MEVSEGQERLYGDLCTWWPLLSRPEDYAEEAAFYRQVTDSKSLRKPRELLELGCGGGNNASHLKKHYRLTLVDRSPGMLKVSQSLNPECQHLLGDMRSIRLNRQFDAVFIHDAIAYMTTLADLHRAIETACIHCKAGGVVLLVPDFTRETFKEHTKRGAHDGINRAMRYLQWTQDPDASDSTYTIDFAYLLKEADGRVYCEHDRHVCGLFSEEDWIKAMTDVGLEAHSEVSPIEGEPGTYLVFVGIKRR